MEEEKKDSSAGADQNLKALLCYLFGFVTGIIFLAIERDKTIRFHAAQSVAVFLPAAVVMWVLGFIPVLGWIINYFLSIVLFILWIVLMVKAYRGEKYRVPYAADIADKFA